MDNLKDAEVRARVPQQMHDELAQVATSRGEQIPVILREALAEYLAKRIGPDASSPQREQILGVLQEKPAVVKALLDLAKAIREPVTYRKASRKGTHSKIPNIVKKGVEQARSQQPQPKSDA